MRTARYYPAFLNLEKKKTTVIGGGIVAERKVRALLAAGARVTVISPALSVWLAHKTRAGEIDHIARRYRRGDLTGSFLVVAASDDVAVNTRVSHDAPGLVNVVDTPHECTFIVPAVVKRGSLTIAVSTSGTSPALAKTIRQELETIYGKEMSLYLSFASTVRAEALALIEDKKKRERFLKRLAAPAMLAKLRKEGIRSVRAAVRKELSSLIS